MKTLNLDSLMADLEKTASITSAAPVTKPNVSAELSGILEKSASVDMTASAVAAGEALAKELLTKLAADNAIQTADAVMVAADDTKVLPNGQGSIQQVLETTVQNAVAKGATSDDVVDKVEDAQTKEAQLKSENSAMAQSIMQKIAQIVGEEVTTPAAAVNLGGAVAPNMIQSANAEMTASDDAKVQPLPGADGSLNDILEAVVARAQEQGAVSDDLVNGDTPASSAEDSQEKVAAVDALVGAGFDFDDAVSMVKEAEVALAADAVELEKVAAVNELLEAGYGFDDAISLVKQAEAELAAEADGYSEIEKVAAVNELMEAGYGFDDAIALVKEAASNHIIKGMVSPAWQEHAIAKDHGKESNAGVGKHIKGALRANGRSIVEGVAGTAVGGGIGAAIGAGIAKAKHLDVSTGAKIGGGIAGGLGLYGGIGHGVYKSLKNQGEEAHQKYAMIKQALSETTHYGTGVQGLKNRAGAYAKSVAADAKDVPDLGRIAKTDAKGALALAKGNKALRLGAGVIAAGGAALAAKKAFEKKAAFDALVEAGVDFDDAMAMVKQAEVDVYGQE